MKIALSLMSLWFTVATPAMAPLSGQVVAVHAGDTLSVQSGGSLHKVRLSEVDAPEMGQVFGKQARQFTEQLALGHQVRVNVSMVDVHGRRIGEVIIDDGWVLNEELVHAGFAWHYRVHPIKNERLQKLEEYAFSKKLGLWVEQAPLPPWEFRREAQIPEAPVTARQVDYNRIFHYGIIGSRRTKTVRWPACKSYSTHRAKQALVFQSLQQARQMGFKPAKGCPR